MKSNIQTSRSFSSGWNVLLLIIAIFGCSKDDPKPAVFIKTDDTQVTFNNINTCHMGGGVYYTEFFFIIPYETSSGVEIEKILYSVTPSATPVENEKTTFADDGSEIYFSLCFKFWNASNFDFTSSLVSKDGVKSKASTVTIDRPTGAN